MMVAEQVHLLLTTVSGALPIILPAGAILGLLIPPATIVWLFLVSLGLQTFFLDIGTTLTLPRVLVPLGLLALVLHAPASLGRAWRQYPARELLIFFLLFLAASILLNLPFLPEKDVQTSAAPVNDILLRGRIGRGLTQWLVFALRAATPLLLIAVMPTRGVAKKFLKLWIIISTIVCLYGAYQVVAFYRGLPAIFVYRGFHDPTGEHPGAFQIASEMPSRSSRIFRVSSLIGEPRDLAGFLLPATVFLGVLALQRRGHGVGLSSRWRGRKLLTLLFLLHAGTFMATFSTGGWIAVLVALPAVAWILWKTTAAWKIGTWLGTTFLLAWLATLLVPNTREIIEERFFNRLSSTVLEHPYYGVPQLRHLMATWPHTIFVGASPGGTLLYEDYLYAEAGIIHYVTELGALGMLIFVLFLVAAFRAIAPRALFVNPSPDPLRVALAASFLASALALLSLTTPEITSALWVFLGFGAVFAARGTPLPTGVYLSENP